MEIASLNELGKVISTFFLSVNPGELVNQSIKLGSWNIKLGGRNKGSICMFHLRGEGVADWLMHILMKDGDKEIHSV